MHLAIAIIMFTFISIPNDCTQCENQFSFNQNIGGAMDEISIGSDRTIFGIWWWGEIYGYLNPKWRYYHNGPWRDLSVVSHDNVWMITGGSAAGRAYQATPEGRTWKGMAPNGNEFERISAADDGTVIALDSSGLAFKRVNNGWEQLMGVGYSVIGVGSASNIWALVDGKAYAYKLNADGSTDQSQGISPVSSSKWKDIDVGSDGFVLALDNKLVLWYWDEDQEAFVRLCTPTQFRRIRIGKKESKYILGLEYDDESANIWTVTGISGSSINWWDVRADWTRYPLWFSCVVCMLVVALCTFAGCHCLRKRSRGSGYNHIKSVDSDQDCTEKE